MSELRCKCGHVIVDQASNLPFAGVVLADRDDGLLGAFVQESGEGPSLPRPTSRRTLAALRAAWGEVDLVSPKDARCSENDTGHSRGTLGGSRGSGAVPCQGRQT